jgi:hypothetical protein
MAERNNMDSNTNQQQVSGWTGWVMFAAFMMILSGILDIIYGLGSLFNQGWFFYANNTLYVIDNNSGGWLLILLGILLFVSGSLLLSGNTFGRIMGIVLATINIIANLAYIGIAPAWSIIAIVVNAVVLYAIGAHGGELKKAG